jgi:hypothetical protein
MQNPCFTGEKQGSKDMFLRKKMLQNINWESKRIMRKQPVITKILFYLLPVDSVFINNYLRERMGIAP